VVFSVVTLWYLVGGYNISEEYIAFMFSLNTEEIHSSEMVVTMYKTT
jgi:hypothetical protein